VHPKDAANTRKEGLTDEHRQDLVIIGHVDSHRMPIIFFSPGRLRNYRAFTTIAFLAFTGQVLLCWLGTGTQWEWIWPMTFVSALCAVLLVALCVQADRTPFSPGAKENVTSAALVLTLAEHLLSEPLRHMRVWLVCTSAEEVHHYGAMDFFRHHCGEMVDPIRQDGHRGDGAGLWNDLGVHPRDRRTGIGNQIACGKTVRQ
jgi:hypothetical protein